MVFRDVTRLKLLGSPSGPARDPALVRRAKVCPFEEVLKVNTVLIFKVKYFSSYSCPFEKNRKYEVPAKQEF